MSLAGGIGGAQLAGSLEGEGLAADAFVRASVPEVATAALVSYSTQVVAGTLYRFTYAGYAHLKIARLTEALATILHQLGGGPAEALRLALARHPPQPAASRHRHAGMPFGGLGTEPRLDPGQEFGRQGYFGRSWNRVVPSGPIKPMAYPEAYLHPKLAASCQGST